MFSGQETGSPIIVVKWLTARIGDLGSQHDITRQVFGFATHPVRQPRSHGWPTRNLMSGQHEGHRRSVIDVIGCGRFDHAQVVNDLAGVGQVLAEHHAGLAL